MAKDRNISVGFINKKDLHYVDLLNCSGGFKGIRTPDLLVANEALSQLSYEPIA